jgi:hypothetical protein
MPRVSQHKWVYNYFKREPNVDKWRCTVCQPPTTTIIKRHPGNMALHLQTKHELDAPKAVGQPTLSFNVMPTLSVDERWALVFATNAWSFRAVENPTFRDLVPDLPSRRQLATLVDSVAQKLRRRALERVQNVTLCIDGGKIHHRYLLLCASTVRGAFVVRVKREDSFPVDDSGPFCSANIRSAIKEVIADLAR